MAVYKVSDSENTERINFLYSPLPSDRNINPKHWESKVSFWTSEVKKSCRYFNDFCLSCQVLRSRFQHNSKVPSCLPVVVENMVREGILLPQSVFLDLSDDTWGKWSYRVVRSSVSWLWGTVSRSNSYYEDQMFVLKDLLEEQSIEFLDQHYKIVKYEKTDNIVPWNVAKSLYKINGKTLDEENMTVLIGFLKSKRKVRVGIQENGEKILKFCAKADKNVDPVTEIDFEVIKLKKTIAKLTMECKQLEKDLESLKTSAQECLRKKDKQQAKKILVQKQKVTKTLTMKQDALMAMKENLRTVREAETTKMITDAFNSSATLLNHSYREQGLTTEKVDEVMDKAAEANQMVNEIEDALSSGLRLLDDQNYDMDELEKELDELQVEEATTANISLTDLPDVPTHIPTMKADEKTSKPQKIAVLS